MSIRISENQYRPAGGSPIRLKIAGETRFSAQRLSRAALVDSIQNPQTKTCDADLILGQ
jgi:hypothetical protein